MSLEKKHYILVEMKYTVTSLLEKKNLKSIHYGKSLTQNNLELLGLFTRYLVSVLTYNCNKITKT